MSYSSLTSVRYKALGSDRIGVFWGADFTRCLSWVILNLSSLAYQAGVISGNSYDFYKDGMRAYKECIAHVSF